MSEPTDHQLRMDLKTIDESDVRVTSWEAGFIESVCYECQGPLSEKQRTAAIKIIDEYWDDV